MRRIAIVAAMFVTLNRWMQHHGGAVSIGRRAGGVSWLGAILAALEPVHAVVPEPLKNPAAHVAGWLGIAVWPAAA